MSDWKDLDPKGYDENFARWLTALGFYDSSWKNDMCPSFHDEASGLRVWIDYLEDPEIEDSPRYELCQYAPGEDAAAGEHFGTLYMGDDLEELKEAIWKNMVTLGEPQEYMRDEPNFAEGCDRIGVDDDWFDSAPGFLSLLVYEPGLYITLNRDDSYDLMIGRNEYHSNDLAHLEGILLAFARDEGYRRSPIKTDDLREEQDEAASEAEMAEAMRREAINAEQERVERKKRIDAEIQRRIDAQEMMHDPGEDVRRIRDIMGSCRVLDNMGTGGGDLQQAFDLMVDSSVLRRIEEELDELISSVQNESWNIVARRQNGR